LKRIFRPGFFSKVSRTSVVEHYGIKTLMYGVFLPAPDIGVGCRKEMRAVAGAGFECGIHTWDHVVWHDAVRSKSPSWTQAQMKMRMNVSKVFSARCQRHMVRQAGK